MTEEHWMQRTYISGDVVASGTIAFMLKVPQTAVWRIVGPRKQNRRRQKEARRLRKVLAPRLRLVNYFLNGPKAGEGGE